MRGNERADRVTASGLQYRIGVLIDLAPVVAAVDHGLDARGRLGDAGGHPKG
jgi:hypothetical protein